MKPIKATAQGRKFLDAYRALINLCNVKRAGFVLSGCYGPIKQAKFKQNGGSFFNNRVQSDAEHCDECKCMVMLLFMLYPEIFQEKPGELEDYARDRFELLMLLVTIHELGEGVSGDIPSDGTRDEARKDQEELKYVSEYLEANFDSSWSELGIRLFCEMQKKSSDIGKLGFLVDKTVAVLRNLLYEEIGRVGDTRHKPNITPLDKKCAAITKSSRNADIWLCNVLINNRSLVSYEHTHIFLEIIQSFALAIRGLEMPWIDDVIADLEDSNST